MAVLQETTADVAAFFINGCSGGVKIPMMSYTAGSVTAQSVAEDEGFPFNTRAPRADFGLSHEDLMKCLTPLHAEEEEEGEKPLYITSQQDVLTTATSFHSISNPYSSTPCRVCKHQKCHTTHTHLQSFPGSHSPLPCPAKLPVYAKDN